MGDLGQERENGEGDEEIIPSKLDPSPLQLKPRQLPGGQTGRPAHPEQRVGRQNLRLDRMSFVAPAKSDIKCSQSTLSEAASFDRSRRCRRSIRPRQ